jgi:hypothetical protein
MGKINAVVIIIHGTNRLDLVTTNNKQRKLLYDARVLKESSVLDINSNNSDNSFFTVFLYIVKVLMFF